MTSATRRSAPPRTVLWTIAVLATLGACTTTEQPLDLRTSALTLSEVFGFEALSAWVVTSGTKSLSAQHTEGASAISVANAVGYTELRSSTVAFSGPAPQTIAYDLEIVTTRPAPSWAGSTSLYVSCPSHNLHDGFVGPRSFDGMPAVEFRTVLFALPSTISTALANGCSDLSFRLAINIPSGTTGSYIVDNLRFNPDMPVTSPSPASVLGFENANEWLISNQPTQPVSPSTIRTQGANAIQFTASGYTVVRSAELATIGPVGSTISYDLWVPGAPPNTWAGQTSLIISVPSRGINATLGPADLGALPAQQFSAVTFAIPGSVQAALSSATYDDLSFSVVLNVNGSATYRLDNLRLGTVLPTLGCIDKLDDAHAVAHFGYTTGLTTSVTIPAGPANLLRPAAGAPQPPTTFAPGTQTDVLQVPFGTAGVAWILGAGSATATMAAPTCFPATNILTCTPGSTVAGCASQVVTQVSASTTPQRNTIIADIERLATMPGFAAAVANDVRATLNPLGQVERILVELSMLGVMKRPEGTQVMKEIVHTPLPTSGTCYSVDQDACEDLVEREYLTQLQSKAIDGLGFLRSSEGDAEVLSAVSDSSNPTLQARAVTAYLWNRGATPTNRAMLASMLPPPRQFLADLFIKDSATTLPVLGQAIIDFYNKHPEQQPRFPQ